MDYYLVHSIFDVCQSPAVLSYNNIRYFLKMLDDYYCGGGVFAFLMYSYIYSSKPFCLFLIMCVCSSKLTQGYLGELNYEMNKLWSIVCTSRIVSG